MKLTKNINVGRRYTCKIRGKDSVCRVQRIDTDGYKKHSTVRIFVQEEETNALYIFRSPSRLIAELGEPVHNIRWQK
jgi:hypothetical protein